jgi:hypothetical protein
MATFCMQIWASGDVSHAYDIMAKDVHLHSLIEGEQRRLHRPLNSDLLHLLLVMVLYLL